MSLGTPPARRREGPRLPPHPKRTPRALGEANASLLRVQPLALPRYSHTDVDVTQSWVEAMDGRRISPSAQSSRALPWLPRAVQRSVQSTNDSTTLACFSLRRSRPPPRQALSRGQHAHNRSPCAALLASTSTRQRRLRHLQHAARPGRGEGSIGPGTATRRLLAAGRIVRFLWLACSCRIWNDDQRDHAAGDTSFAKARQSGRRSGTTHGSESRRAGED